MLRVGGGGIATFQIRVPVDDTDTWQVWYYRFDSPASPQDAIPVYRVPLYDEHGEWLRSSGPAPTATSYAGVPAAA